MREPPHNLEAERSTLGSVFIKPKVIGDLTAVLDVDDFYLPTHRDIYQSMLFVDKREMPCDPVMIADDLKARGMLMRIEGGEQYLLEMAGAVPTAENVTHYAGLVKEAAAKRRLISLCGDVVARAYGDARAQDLIEDMAGEMSSIISGSPKRLTSIGDLLQHQLDTIEARAQRGPDRAITGVRTGVRALDELTLGWQPGNLVIIGAETGGGKSALLGQAALTLTVEDEGTALVCNLEMPNDELAERAVVREALVNSHHLRRGSIDHDDWRRIYAAGGKLSPAKLYFEDRAIRLRDIIARARLWRARHPTEVGLLVVDYLQLVRSPEGSRETRVRELGIMCAELKQLAKDLRVVVAVAAQLNRSAAKRDEPPTINDFRESGEIEQLADTAILIWNHGQDGPTEDGPVDAIVGKNRKGPRRTVQIWWTGRYYRFSDLEDAPVAGRPTQAALPGWEA